MVAGLQGQTSEQRQCNGIAEKEREALEGQMEKWTRKGVILRWEVYGKLN